MTKSKNYSLIMVDKKFHKKIKSESAINGDTIISYTRKLAINDCSLKELFEKKENEKKNKKFYGF